MNGPLAVWRRGSGELFGTLISAETKALFVDAVVTITASTGGAEAVLVTDRNGQFAARLARANFSLTADHEESYVITLNCGGDETR